MGKTRRRGVVLEAAIYQAVREIIDQDGIEAVTFQKVAAAAGTSKPVIYRRWDTPFELAIAAIQDKIRQDNQGRTDELVLIGTNLREDLLQVLQRFLISVNTFGRHYLQSLLAEISHHENASLRKMIDYGAQIDIHALERVIQRAHARGESVRTDLTTDLKLLPFDWIRYNILIQADVDTARLTQLIDDILLPVYLRS